MFTHLVRLPRYTELFEGRDQLHKRKITEIESNIDLIRQDIADIKANLYVIPNLDERIVNLQYRLDDLRQTYTSKHKNTDTHINNTVSDNHDFDHFYKLFEDEFRGSEEVIKERVSEHLVYFSSLPPKIKNLPIIDIGCGRGEFLSLMKEHKFKAIGVDMNKRMVDRANSLGFKAVESDALTYLKSQKTNSIVAITGFHIVEHIPFEPLMKVFEECYRTVIPGGFTLFETPNPQALTVGANTFYLDPSHQRPIPPPLLEFMLKSVGFKTSIITLHRVKPKIKHPDSNLVEIYEALYGPGDYAVIGRRT
ncbi:MAG: methyltransferase domain-containing protein [Candidatus Saccharimonadales bacterium]